MFGSKERQEKLEQQVLSVITEAQEPVHAYAIGKALNPEKPWAHGTLYRPLRHLVELGLVEQTIDEEPYDYDGPPRRYYATIPQEPTVEVSTES